MMVKIMQKLLIIMEVFKNIFCLSKFAWAQGMVFFLTSVENLVTHPQKDSLALS